MVRLTLIARTRDGLPLAEGLDADKEHEMYSYKSQAKVRRRGRRWDRRAVGWRLAAFGRNPAAETQRQHACKPPLVQGILKKMAASSSRPPERMSIESGPFTFHYLIDSDVVYLTLAEKAYPKKLAFQYLEELQSEFSRLYGGQIEAVTRPYAFIKFGAWRTAAWAGWAGGPEAAVLGLALQLGSILEPCA